jgi:hypothetical protein
MLAVIRGIGIMVANYACAEYLGYPKNIAVFVFGFFVFLTGLLEFFYYMWCIDPYL